MHWEHGVLTPGPQGKSLQNCFNGPVYQTPSIEPWNYQELGCGSWNPKLSYEILAGESNSNFQCYLNSAHAYGYGSVIKLWNGFVERIIDTNTYLAWFVDSKESGLFLLPHIFADHKEKLKCLTINFNVCMYI